ncbi:hypothetical protein Peur_027553 [Populus x canadensis]
MGLCFSDVRGGKQAIGGTSQQNPNSNNNAAHNDAVDFFFKSNGQQALFTQVELSLSASNLLDRDITSKSLKLKDQEFLGEANCVLSEIVTRQNRTLTIQLQNRNGHGILRKIGTLTAHAEETIASRTTVELTLRKLQKSVADLETLHREKNGANFVIPSSHVREKAIMEVGHVIQFYDSDRRFPAWGFGGKTPAGTVSHCFNLNGSASFEVEGVDGIMAAYATALHNVSLSGPTLFGPVINTAAQIAGQSVSNNNGKYLVLLIITDGVITDMQETKDSLVRASDLPLSILIVGVGGADFTQMEILDADNGERLQSSTGRVATRDIVQFVPMREVNSGQISVVQALLEELPGQFLTYFRSRDIKPHARHSCERSPRQAFFPWQRPEYLQGGYPEKGFSFAFRTLCFAAHPTGISSAQ